MCDNKTKIEGYNVNLRGIIRPGVIFISSIPAGDNFAERWFKGEFDKTVAREEPVTGQPANDWQPPGPSYHAGVLHQGESVFVGVRKEGVQFKMSDKATAPESDLLHKAIDNMVQPYVERIEKMRKELELGYKANVELALENESLRKKLDESYKKTEELFQRQLRTEVERDTAHADYQRIYAAAITAQSALNDSLAVKLKAKGRD